MTKRHSGATKELFIAEGTKLALGVGLSKITPANACRACAVSKGLLFYYFDSLDEYIDAIVLNAIEKSELKVVAEAIVCRHRLASIVPDELKRKAIESFLG